MKAHHRLGSLKLRLGGDETIDGRDPAMVSPSDFATIDARYQTYRGTNGDDAFAGSSKRDLIFGKGGNDTLSGGGRSDQIHGDAGDNTLSGDGGDDRIYSDGGRDTVDGGAGYDVWYGSYADHQDALSFDERTGVGPNGSTITGVELVELTTGSGNDSFYFTGTERYDVTAGYGVDDFTASYADSMEVSSYLTVSLSVAQDGSLSGSVLLNALNRIDRFSGIETLSLTGSAYSDSFTLSKDVFSGSLSIALDGGDGFNN